MLIFHENSHIIKNLRKILVACCIDEVVAPESPEIPPIQYLIQSDCLKKNSVCYLLPSNLHVDEVEHVVGESSHIVALSIELHLQVLRPKVLHPLDDLRLDAGEVGRVQPADGLRELFAPGGRRKKTM